MRVPALVTVTIHWLYFGGGETSLSKTIKLNPGTVKRVPFSKPATLAEISRTIGWEHGDTMCPTTATMSRAAT